ncbi:heterokaryon incompatibility protein-domain-containing protein, partial [Tricladium varicosporioides]
LTYCWGNAKITKTTTRNISEYKQEIKFGSLSKVFQDAIIVTRKLGFRYIWIDALCIIQDSKDDWEKEAALMTEVYSNAAITLSAAVSVSGCEGLFSPRRPLNSARLMFKGTNGAPDGFCSFTAVSAKTFGDDVLKGALSVRGWTLQERLLSRRIIHFGRDQLHWECQKTIRSENFDATSSRFFGNRIYHGLTELLHQKNPHSGGTTPYFLWYYIIVPEYTKRCLTYQKDILVAIIGIAKFFGARLQDKYIWGLWEKDLPRGLLWNTAREYGGRAAEINAPSWSWLSISNC